MKKPKSKPKTDASMMAKSGKLGVSRSTLYSWKEAGCPVEKDEGAIIEWAMNENKRPTETDAMRAAKLEVLLETARRLKIANDQKARTLIPIEEMSRDVSQLTGIYWAGLDRFVWGDLPPQLEGLTAIEIAKVLMDRIDVVRCSARAALAELAGDAPQAAEEQKKAYERMEWNVKASVGHMTFKERCSHEYDTFKDWLKVYREIGHEKRIEWLRLRAACNLWVWDATDEECAKYGVHRTRPPEVVPFDPEAYPARMKREEELMSKVRADWEVNPGWKREIS